MLLLENNVNDYKKMIEIQRKLSSKEAKQSIQRIWTWTKRLGGSPIKELEDTWFNEKWQGGICLQRTEKK